MRCATARARAGAGPAKGEPASSSRSVSTIRGNFNGGNTHGLLQEARRAFAGIWADCERALTFSLSPQRVGSLQPPTRTPGEHHARGSVFAGGTGEWLQWDNLTQALRDNGLSAPTRLTKIYDISGTLGGPIVRDRVWYFVNTPAGGSTRASANVWYNLNAGDAAKWL